MPEIKVVTEVAGRVCALPVEAGASVNEGDDVAFVEAMKMEIPSPRRPRESSNRCSSRSTTLSPKDRCWRLSRREFA